MKTLASFVIAILLTFAFWRFLDHPQNIAEPDIAADQKLQCVSYAPFRGKESPDQFGQGLKIPTERIDEDLALLAKKSECVRTYSITGLEALPELAAKHGLKVLFGIWIGRDAKNNETEITTAIDVAKKYPDVIRAVIVGNEVLLRREQTQKDTAALIKRVKDALPNMAVTYADVWEFWLMNPELKDSVDFITIHMLPYWENHPTRIDDAVEHIKNMREKVAEAFPGKEILIGESGWPSEGRARKDAVPSLKNEARFLRGFVAAANAGGWRYNFIEAFDQPWKRNNEGAVGGFWGVFSADRQDKGLLQGPVGIFPDATTWFLLGLVIFCVTFIITKNPWIAITLALSQSFWWREAFVCNRFRDEWILTSAVSLLALIWSLKIKEKFLPLLLLVTCVITMRTGLGLVFDSRYRVLPWAGYFAPLVFAAFTLHKNNLRQEQKLWFTSGIALLTMAVAILINETFLNITAVTFVTLLVIFSIALIQNTEHPKQLFTKKDALCLVGFFSVLAVATLIRYRLMEEETLSAICADGNKNGLCGIRAQFGVMIHFKIWAWISLLPTFIGIYLRRNKFHSTLITLGFILSPLGLVLYNVDLASWAFVMSLGMVATTQNTQAGSL